MTLSIIIVNYNVKYFVEQCLISIYRSQGVDLNEIEVFVVDNLSKDNSAAYLKKQFPITRYPHIHILTNKRNVGFGRANNQAIRKANGKYILFLNPDTLLTEHTLRDILSATNELTNMGVAGVKMIHTDGSFAMESRRGVPSPWVSFCKMAGLNSLFPKSKIFGKYYMRYLSTEKVSPIDIISGAFMLTSAEALKKVGMFDETFFMYGEDIDLSFRFLKAGYSNYYIPTPLLHYKGESTKKNSYHYVHVFYEAMLIFFKKHYKHYNFILSFPIKLAIILRAIMALIVQQTQNLHKFLHPRNGKMPKRMLYIGKSSDMVKQIAEEYGLSIDYLSANETSLPKGHHSLTTSPTYYSQIIYDISDFSIGFILDRFEEKPYKQVQIGTFNAERGIIITTNNIYFKD